MHKHAISFKNAFNGIWVAISTQNNIRIHFFVASILLITAVYMQISMSDVLVLVLTISLVITAEMINTALEFLSDAVTLESNPLIKNAKDVSAGAVLLSSIFAIIIGFIIFIPKLIL
jgi:diacylglycerol kinase